MRWRSHSNEGHEGIVRRHVAISVVPHDYSTIRCWQGTRANFVDAKISRLGECRGDRRSIAAVAEVATEKESIDLRDVLSLLVSDSRMRLVWRELYKKKRINHKATDEFCYPACVTNASAAAANRRRASELRKKTSAVDERDARLLEAEATVLEREGDPPADPRWSEQDRAVKLFLRHTYRIALDLQPVFLSDLQLKMKKLREVAEVLRKQATALQSLGMKGDARKLNEIASDCDDEALNVLPERHVASDENDGSIFTPQADDPWIITRQSGDVELRAFVADLSITTASLFGKDLHRTVATVANVVFNRQDVTRDNVREMLRR